MELGRDWDRTGTGLRQNLFLSCFMMFRSSPVPITFEKPFSDGRILFIKPVDAYGNGDSNHNVNGDGTVLSNDRNFHTRCKIIIWSRIKDAYKPIIFEKCMKQICSLMLQLLHGFYAT